jgi:uroporphyrin-III C-methyltransferase
VSVHLVGAGPGDPGLITVRGLELVRNCDVLVYDRLVASELVDEAPQDAIRIARERHTQPEVNELLVGCGRAGLDVVRLKGGDPFVFGRGGEEALALAEAGVEFEIVSGVSALGAVPAAAGIPVTHRGLASQVTLVTAHCARGEGRPPDYAALARAPGTLVFFMSLHAIPELAAELIANGRAPETPAAAIASGTSAEQETVVSSLAELPLAAAGLRAPVLVVVGEVVSLADRLGPQERVATASARAVRNA